MRRYLWSLVGVVLAAGPLPAQGLRDKISQLFIFANGKDPLFLGGTAGSDSATALHADHFVPSANADNGSLISFISGAISQNVGNLPVSATSGERSKKQQWRPGSSCESRPNAGAPPRSTPGG